MELKNFLIPAVDIKEGKVVRLLRGEFDKKKEYPYVPEELARKFQEAGFKRIHVVDLDGAKGGRPANLDQIRKIRKVFGGIMQVGGGIRSFDIARLLFEEGVDYIVVGTIAIRNPAEFEKVVTNYPNRVILALDSRGGKVAVGGWREESSLSPKELATSYESMPLWGYLYTIIEKDGSLEGVDTKPYEELKKFINRPILASGGVSSLKDLESLHPIVEGVVVGKALYEGKIPIGGLLSSGNW